MNKAHYIFWKYNDRADAPRDAALPWQVMLLLQSSDRIAHDISEAHPACCGLDSSSGGGPAESRDAGDREGDGGAGIGSRADGDPGSGAAAGAGVPLTLALRQWRSLTPGREFRCFVAQKDLIGALRGRVPRGPRGPRGSAPYF